MTDGLDKIFDDNGQVIGNGDYYQTEVLADIKLALNAYILGEVMAILGMDDAEVRGTTQDPTNPKYWTKRTKIRNDLRQELRNKANKRFGGK